MKIVVASNNKHKLVEIRDILKDYFSEILSLTDVNIDIDIEENGRSFEENALIKARTIVEKTGLVTIADDSGLEVEAIGWQPGIYSARYANVAGEDKDRANREKLLKELKDVPQGKRTARFCSAIACVYPDGKEIVCSGYVWGTIGFEEKGDKGFGYDSLFIVDKDGRTMAEMSEGEKNAISHRAVALQKLKEQLKG